MDMEQKLDVILEKISNLEKITTETRKMLDPITKRVSKVEEKQDIVEDKVYDLQCQVAWLEQYGMKNDIIISGLLEEKEEQEERSSRITGNRATKNAVIKLAKKLGVDLDERDIVIAHRIIVRGSSDEDKKKIPNIIVRLVYTEKKQLLLAASKEKKPKNEEQGNIYCNDHLSHYTWELLHLARQIRDNGQIKYVWIQDGKVLIRESEKSKAVRVWSSNHLNYVVNQIQERRSSCQTDDKSLDPNMETASQEGRNNGNTVEERINKKTTERNQRELRTNVRSKYRGNSLNRGQATMHKYVKGNVNK